MTPVTSDAPQVEDLPLEKVMSYVQKTGWRRVPHPNQNLMVFQGPNDDLGQPIQLVLPQSTHFWDSSTLIAGAITLLADIEERTPEEIKVAIQLESESDKNSSIYI